MTAKSRTVARDDAPAVETNTGPQAAEVAAETKAPERDWKTAITDCVVDDGTGHTGRAVPGTKVCSRHTMHYKNDGTPR